MISVVKERIKKNLNTFYFNWKELINLIMIVNFKNYLKYFTLEIKEDDLKVSSIVLKELSKYLPPSLHYLNLNLLADSNDLKIFFKNSNQVELKKLLIRNKSKSDIEVILSVIKDFIKEKI